MMWDMETFSEDVRYVLIRRYIYTAFEISGRVITAALFSAPTAA
jgi:hypothetical protein